MSSDPSEMQIFDRNLLRLRRARLAEGFGDFNFLHREFGERLLDRLDDIQRSFPLAVDLDSRQGLIQEMLAGRGGIETLISCDLVPEMLPARGPSLVVDPEFLPFAPDSIDLFISSMGLHWINDLPGALIQIRRALKPDGLLLASMLGGDTLIELRRCLADAEIEVSGGLSPRLSPLTDIRDAGALLQRAGFALPVVDSDRITVTYDNAFRLMADLHGMCESNIVSEQIRHFTPRSLLMRAAELYQERFAGADGRIVASFHIINLTAWAPAPGQQQPLSPGSGQKPLAQALGAGDPLPTGAINWTNDNL